MRNCAYIRDMAHFYLAERGYVSSTNLDGGNGTGWTMRCPIPFTPVTTSRMGIRAYPSTRSLETALDGEFTTSGPRVCGRYCRCFRRGGRWLFGAYFVNRKRAACYVIWSFGEHWVICYRCEARTDWDVQFPPRNGKEWWWNLYLGIYGLFYLQSWRWGGDVKLVDSEVLIWFNWLMGHREEGAWVRAPWSDSIQFSGSFAVNAEPRKLGVLR